MFICTCFRTWKTGYTCTIQHLHALSVNEKIKVQVRYMRNKYDRQRARQVISVYKSLLRKCIFNVLFLRLLDQIQKQRREKTNEESECTKTCTEVI